MTLSVSDALRQRISTRAFLDTPVSEDQVRGLLELASRAPSGGNLQPWQVHVVAGEAMATALRHSRKENRDYSGREPTDAVFRSMKYWQQAENWRPC